MNWKRTFILLATLAFASFMVCGPTMAATHSKFVTGNPVYAPADENSVYVISNVLDFADLSTTGNGTTGALAGVTRGDTVQLLDIPAGTLVMNVIAEVYSAWGTSGVTTAGITIGDGTDPNGWITAFDLGNTASGVSSANGAYVLVTTDFDTGKYYSAADTIDAVFPNWALVTTAGVTNAQMRIHAICITPKTQEAYTH